MALSVRPTWRQGRWTFYSYKNRLGCNGLVESATVTLEGWLVGVG